MVTTAGDAGACEGPTVEGGIVGHVAVDIDRSAVTADRQGQVGTGSGCRICQLEDGDLPAESGSGQLVNLGCGCRGEIAAAHRRCAEAWFSVRGNRYGVFLVP
uniref:RING-CH-type domain-containing protein n=1 Tax=Aegilops tauschii subsp. strangulata TaxID=200361 RepID=A0A452Y6I2_AEGTS